MNRDAGQKATSEQLAPIDGKVLSELSINDDGRLRYVYLLKGNLTRSQKDYAEYDEKPHTLKTDTWSMQTGLNNEAVEKPLKQKHISQPNKNRAI